MTAYIHVQEASRQMYNGGIHPGEAPCMQQPLILCLQIVKSPVVSFCFCTTSSRLKSMERLPTPLVLHGAAARTTCTDLLHLRVETRRNSRTCIVLNCDSSALGIILAAYLWAETKDLIAMHTVVDSNARPRLLPGPPQLHLFPHLV